MTEERELVMRIQQRRKFWWTAWVSDGYICFDRGGTFAYTEWGARRKVKRLLRRVERAHVTKVVDL